MEAESSKVIVEQVMDPVTMHDGSTFYGLYPKFPLPERCFSDDNIMYFTIKQHGTLISIAVDINTNQVKYFYLKYIKNLQMAVRQKCDYYSFIFHSLQFILWKISLSLM